MRYISVGLGGATGAMLRYLLILIIPMPTHIPFITMGINCLGSLLFGFLFFYIQQKNTFYLFLTTGLLGGFTTFSTFSIETISLFEQQLLFEAFASIFGTVISCIIGVFLGAFIAKGVRR